MRSSLLLAVLFAFPLLAEESPGRRGAILKLTTAEYVKTPQSIPLRFSIGGSLGYVQTWDFSRPDTVKHKTSDGQRKDHPAESGRRDCNLFGCSESAMGAVVVSMGRRDENPARRE